MNRFLQTEKIERNFTDGCEPKKNYWKMSEIWTGGKIKAFFVRETTEVGNKKKKTKNCKKMIVLSGRNIGGLEKGQWKGREEKRRSGTEIQSCSFHWCDTKLCFFSFLLKTKVVGRGRRGRTDFVVIVEKIVNWYWWNIPVSNNVCVCLVWSESPVGLTLFNDMRSATRYVQICV